MKLFTIHQTLKYFSVWTPFFPIKILFDVIFMKETRDKETRDKETKDKETRDKETRDKETGDGETGDVL